MLSLDRSGTTLSISVNGVKVIEHRQDAPFAYMGRGRESVSMYRGNFDIVDRMDERIGLGDADVARRGDGYLITFSRDGGLSLSMEAAMEDGRLALRFPVVPAGMNRFWFRTVAEPGEHLYGGGEQFSKFELSGFRFPLWSSEQGVGRNKRTRITFEADVNDRAGGDYWWTFYPEPTYVSSRRYFLHADGSAYAAFDFRDPGAHELEFWAPPERIVVGTGETLLEVVKDVSALLGRQPELPDWVHDGIILGIQGGTDTCQKKLDIARARGVPVSGIWAQDWEGKRLTSFGKRLMWNWAWDPELYPGLPEALARWREEGIRFLGYANPYVAAEKELFREAAEMGLLAKDVSGKDYLVDFGEFYAGIVDFTNPAAFEWYKGVVRRNLVDFGLSGWMADFGEYLPTDAVLFDGTPAMLAHNAWPAVWARINREAIEEAGRMDEVVFFMRAGYTGSQRWCPMMWAGDQNVDWSEDDGLPSVIPAALSLAMCGHGLHHSDIGGYTTLYGMKRTKELFLRWAEFAAFTPMMRTHEGNRPDDNWQFDSDAGTLDGLARMGRAFVALKPYRKAVVAENARDGVPAMRPVFLHYENDERSYTAKDAYLFGRDLLVAPVMEEGATERLVHLPDDEWKHLWTGTAYAGGDHRVAAPIGRPPVFYRTASPWAGLFGTLDAAADGVLGG